MKDKEEYELINNKNDTCDNCAFAHTDCPNWAMEECSGTNKVWVVKKNNNPSEITTGQAVAIITCGCLTAIVLTALIILANAFAVGYVLHKFFNI